MNQADLYSQWPILAIVALVASSVVAFGFAVWRELKDYQVKQAETWRKFMREENKKCWERQEKSESSMYNLQLEMANSMQAFSKQIDTRLNRVEDAIIKMTTIIETSTSSHKRKL